MNKIQDILNDVNLVDGVRGSAMTTSDGIMIASALQDRFVDDVVAGLTSFLLSTTKRAMGEDDVVVERFVMYATHGRLVLVSLGHAYLVVITDQFAKLTPLLSEIDDTARRLRRVAKMNV